MNNLTFKQYRNIDLSIFALLVILSEAITTVATNNWFVAQPVAISTTIIFICILMMRWSAFAFIHAIVGGVVFCVASGASAEHFIIYSVGNCLALCALLWFKLLGKEKVRKDGFLLTLYTFSVYLLMQVGRWLLSLCFGGGVGDLVGYLSTDIISLLFAVVIMLILRKTDGMIEDQKAYLFRLERERLEEQQSSGYGGYGSED